MEGRANKQEHFFFFLAFQSLSLSFSISVQSSKTVLQMQGKCALYVNEGNAQGSKRSARWDRNRNKSQLQMYESISVPLLSHVYALVIPLCLRIMELNFCFKRSFAQMRKNLFVFKLEWAWFDSNGSVNLISRDFPSKKKKKVFITFLIPLNTKQPMHSKMSKLLFSKVNAYHSCQHKVWSQNNRNIVLKYKWYGLLL